MFVAVMALLLVAFIVPAVGQWYVSCVRRRLPPCGRCARGLPLFHRCLSVLLAYIILLGPGWFEQAVRADVAYGDLLTAYWATGGTTVEYTYDANGSVKSKTTKTGSIVDEAIVYDYNLQGRLARITRNGSEITEYAYNDEGIRVRKVHTVGASRQTTFYLIDPYNHTGYAQVLEELVYDGSTTDPQPDPLIDTPDSRRTYTIGDDVISQGDSATDVKYLLYDGHGSTRHLTNSSGAVLDSYSYDAYGMMLGGSPGSAQNPTLPATNLLYTGEQFDTAAQQYYLRARYYDPSNGRFNRVDPFPGNPQDPQSLHKYTYCHNNPVDAVDPSGTVGEFSMIGQMVAFATISLLLSANVANAPGPDDYLTPDASGDLYLDAYITVASTVLIVHVILPVARRIVVRAAGRLRWLFGSGAGPGRWASVRESMSPRAAQYQSQITGKPAGQAYVADGVKFDGYARGSLLEAKGPGYKEFVENGKFADWFAGKEALLEQAQRQVIAAGGAPVEWHVAEKEALPALKELLKGTAAEHMRIVHTPMGQ